MSVTTPLLFLMMEKQRYLMNAVARAIAHIATTVRNSRKSGECGRSSSRGGQSRKDRATDLGSARRLWSPAGKADA